MSMEKASMNKDYLPMSREDDVRSTWQMPTMQAVPKPEAPKKRPNTQLGLRVPAANAAHALATRTWGQRVHMGLTEFLGKE